MISLRRSTRVVTLLLVLSVPFTGCASIPKETDPEMVKRVDEGKPTTSTTIEAPPEGMDAPDLVRDFVDAGAQPANDYEAARKHLSGRARNSWQVPSEVTVVKNVDTVPLRKEDLPNSVQMVSLSVDKVGKLRADRSFVPGEGSEQLDIRVERQDDGEWRIANPPDLLLASRSSFVSNYRAVSVFFLDEQQNGVVPDVRWVRQNPQSTLPSRVIDLLLSGPSAGFDSAMNTAIPENTETVSNVSEVKDGALLVNLSDLGSLSSKKKRMIAAQVVLTLRGVRTARVQLEEEGTALLSNSSVLRPSDVASYERQNKVSSEVAPLAVVNEKLVVFNEQAPPVPGPMGSGEYAITTAARSDGGERIAAVVRSADEGVDLRVGEYGGSLRKLPVHGSFISRPTWRSESEVWAVVDGKRMVRATRDDEGNWSVEDVDVRGFAADRGHIEALRISRDGTRLAGVVGGRIVVAGIAGSGSTLRLQRPTPLTGGFSDSKIKKVAWLNSRALVAISDSDSTPVVKVSVDGFFWKSYNSSNLRQPLRRLTVGPGQKVIVGDRSYLWQAMDREEVWEVLQDIPVGPQSIPFYPG
ncbi:LpqB family beta-propeller domain-containing protein [Actinopolyspora saharensis]|uniref:Sporulation and spore germination n=1 Tax=Actinopolyspora saharensis TaxID=995062 RepID=A0A1H1E7R4_9ACTN|nr:LpqB family beta-propeller domain-containing protein [Actinopolyspora saharensis]SDQ84767.1 Sporulation and spore germination [Actinopolyspora saharensis]